MGRLCLPEQGQRLSAGCGHAGTRGLEIDVSASEAGEVQNRAAMRLYCTLRLTGWEMGWVGRRAGRFFDQVQCRAGQGRVRYGTIRRGGMGWMCLGLVWRDVDMGVGCVGCGMRGRGPGWDGYGKENLGWRHPRSVLWLRGPARHLSKFIVNQQVRDSGKSQVKPGLVWGRDGAQERSASG